MSTTTTHTPTSLLRFGLARVDITPPVGIYHPNVGSRAPPPRHGCASSADWRRPWPLGQRAARKRPCCACSLDMVGLDKKQHELFTLAASEGSGLPVERVLVACSHTHAGGLFMPDRQALPGGDLIAPYLQSVEEKLHAKRRRKR